jgi:hypothetical protein
MQLHNHPSGEVRLKTSLGMLSVLYFSGAALFFSMLNADFFSLCMVWIGVSAWGISVKNFREFIERYPIIGLARGFWFLRPEGEALGEPMLVSLRLNSVIIPGLLLLSFQDEAKKSYSFLVFPAMVGGREKFSWLSRYAKLSPEFQ